VNFSLQAHTKSEVFCKKSGKKKLRLSFDNRSVANPVIHLPLQKLLTSCSISMLFGSCAQRAELRQEQ
jgi:hypothetical protein